MVMEMKRVVLLLSVVLLTGAAPLHQNNVLSGSQVSQATSHVPQFRGTPESDIIIRAPAGFGKPNKNGQSIVTVSLRDESSNITVDVVSFIFSMSGKEVSEVQLGESFRGAGGAEVRNRGEGLEKDEEETLNVGDGKSDGDQRHSTRSKSEESHPLQPTTTTSDTSILQEESTETDSESEHQNTKVHTESAEPHVLYQLPEQLTGLRSALGSTLIHQESTHGKETVPRSDTRSVENQTVPPNSEPMSGPFQTASVLSSSSEEESDDEYKKIVTDPSLSKMPSLSPSPEYVVKPEVVKKNEHPPTHFFSGSDFNPDYVNDEWQYDPRYYDPYRNHPGYVAGYDPYGAGYDHYGGEYDPYGKGYDPYGGGYDPYGAGYDPYGGGYDPYGAGYDAYQAEHDPYSEAHDPYHAGYDRYGAGYDNQEPHHETEDQRHDAVPESTPVYSAEENERSPTEISNNQDNSHSEEQLQSPSISPTSTPAALPEGSDNMDSAHILPSEEPSNSSSIETSRELRLQPSKGLNDSDSPHGSAKSISEESRAGAGGKNMATTGSFSSEESFEMADSDQESQNPMDHMGNQGTPDPTSSQVSHNMQEIPNEEELQSQSPVDLLPAFSSEEDDPLVSSVKHIMSLSFNARSNQEGLIAGKSPDSAPSDNTISDKNQNEESVHLTTFDSESEPTSDSLVSHEDTSSENTASNPTVILFTTTQSSDGSDNSAEANANTANDSQESQESQIFTPSTRLHVASQGSHVQHTENSSDEEDTQYGKSNQRSPINQFPVETPAKIIATNLWTSFLQALRVPLANHSRTSVQKNVQTTRHYHQRSNWRQNVHSSEEIPHVMISGKET